ncbi:unnamed protein product [Brachionus calyciflorus]|uniref:Cilia- and flagella-associated protein 97 n=1 Tax=Brachionus calyciflorus TaxID=104777 RepID=A0A813NBA7_9BILA|nr:unnamed protein product [Brachionus calyciflorus]
MSKKDKNSRNLSLSSSDSDDDKKSSLLKNSKNTKNSRSSTPSTDRSSERSKKDERNNFPRPSSRQKKSSSDSSSDEKHKSKSNSHRSSSTLSKKSQIKSEESDTDSDSTIKKGSTKNDTKFDRPRSSRAGEKKKPILRSSSSSSRSRSNSPSIKKKNSDSEDDSTTLGSSILKVKIDSKPPIDKKSRRKTSSRLSNFEKPNNSDSDSDFEHSNSHSLRSKNSKNLNDTFEKDSQDSSNDMTDVSSLPSPRETREHRIRNKVDKSDEEASIYRGRTAFYSALNQKSQTRPNSVNFNFANNYTRSTDFNEKTYGRELMRIEAQQRRMFSVLLKENEGKNKIIERPIRITSSAINRQREQQRIEKENHMILKRLLSVKSSKEVRKESQLRDYEKNMGVSDLNISRSSSKSTLSTKRSQKSSACNSRISSAKSTRGDLPFEYSTRALSLSRRPEWNDRW